MKKHLNALIEALIDGDTKAGEEALHEYMTAKTRALLGEKEEDADEDDEMDADADEDKDDEESDEDDSDDEESDEDDDEESDEDDEDEDDKPVEEGMSSKQRSNLAKKAKKGKDIGKPGKNFKKVAAKAAKEYGSEEAGEKVAAAAMWKNAGKKAKK